MFQVPGEFEPSRESSLESQPFKLQVKPRDGSNAPSPDEYTDDQGRKVKRIVKTTVKPLNVREEKAPTKVKMFSLIQVNETCVTKLSDVNCSPKSVKTILHSSRTE